MIHHVPGWALLLMLLGVLLVPYAFLARRLDRIAKADTDQWLRRWWGTPEINKERSTRD